MTGAELHDATRLWSVIEGLADSDVGSPWTYSGAARYDGVGLDQWLLQTAKTGFGPFVVKMMAGIGGSGAFEPADVSLLRMAYTQGTGPQREHPEAYLFDGTAGQVPPLIAAHFSPRVNVDCDAPVRRIEQSSDAVLAHAAAGCNISSRRTG